MAYQEGILRQLVRPLPDGARQRAGGGGAVLALRPAGASRRSWTSGFSGSPITPRNCSQHCDQPPGLAREGHHHAEELDRQEHRARRSGSRSRSREGRHPRVHHPAGHGVRRHLHVSGPGASPGAGAVPGTAQENEVARLSWTACSQQDTVKRTAGDLRKGRRLHRGALHQPVHRRRMPIYTANFALMEYGTGAVMAVPAHDQRDFEFARRNTGCRSSVVIQPDAGETSTPSHDRGLRRATGVMVELRPSSTGCPTTGHGGHRRCTWRNRASGKRTVNFRLRDWGISRQRYWGAPIPDHLLRPAAAIVPVPEKDLPVVLPEDVDLLEGGQSPLPALRALRRRSTCPTCGRPGPPGNRHHGHLRGVVLVFRALSAAPH